MMGDLPDVNVLFALLHPGHPHWTFAQRWLERHEKDNGIQICRVVQMGALRLMTMPSVMKEDVKTPAEFWEGYKAAMRDDRFAFSSEPIGFEEAWEDLCRGLPRGTSGNTDTYLAAFALAGGHTLVTFDGGFARFSDLSVEILRG